MLLRCQQMLRVALGPALNRLSLQGFALLCIGAPGVGVLAACGSDAASVQYVSASADAALGADATGGSDGVAAGDAAISSGLQVQLEPSDAGSSVVLRRTVQSDHAHHCLWLRQTQGDGSTLEKKLCTKAAGSDRWLIGSGSGASPWSSVAGLREGPATWAITGGASAGLATEPVASGTLRIGPFFDGPCSAKTAAAAGLVQWHDTAPVALDVAIALGEDVRADADVITPAYWVETVRLAGKPKSGNTVQLQYTAKQPGLHVIEVNGLAGSAVLNCPVYVAADVPLVPVQIPSFLSGDSKQPTQAEREAMRTQLLALINAARSLVALSPLVANDLLTRMAQDHTDDMVARGYFGHYSPEGAGPADRAVAAGWQGSIGENVAAHAKLDGAHAGLWWSAAHRKNILGPFGYVGLGIGRAKNGLLYVTENFGSP